MSTGFQSPNDRMSSHHVVFLEELYEDYLQDPNSVEPEWRNYFAGLSNGASPSVPRNGKTRGNSSLPQRKTAAPTYSMTAHKILQDSLGTVHAAPPASLLPTTGDWSAFHSGSHIDLPQLEDSDELLSTEQRLAFLRRLSLFQRVPEETLQQVAEISTETRFEDGVKICTAGEPGTNLYIVLRGEVVIKRGQQVLTQLSVGQVVGELSVLDSRPRSADAYSKGKTQLLQIRKDDFQRLLEKDNVLTLSLLSLLAARVREASTRQERVSQLVRAYRQRGHVMANINPLGSDQTAHPELTLEFYGLGEDDLDTPFSSHLGQEPAIRTLRQILERLHTTYCREIGVQYMHIDDLHVQEWLRVRMEETQNQAELDREKQLRILRKLTDAEGFETFLHRQFLGAKRFSLEGAESLIPLLDQAIEKAGEYKVEEVVIGMAHRGRLNVLANIMNKPVSQIFREFEDVDPELHLGRGDVKYHMGYSSDHPTPSGQSVHLSLCFNPSHLEFVGPVVLGRVRCKQDRRQDEERSKVLAVIIHGDAAFSGQGIVQEMLNLSQLPGYRVGGTIHIVLNNQVGFTTTPEQGRSCHYATDVARMLQIPIFHVNGEHPEAVNQVIELAMDFRDTFQRDVIIDMYCYRRHGHNEGDEPNFTQPLMYEAIRKRESVRVSFVENLLKLGKIQKEEADTIAEQSNQRLKKELEQSRSADYKYVDVCHGAGVWTNYKGGPNANVAQVETHVPKETLQALLRRMTEVPEDFEPHRKIKRFFKRDQERIQGKQLLDWGTAEKLAFATILEDGVRIRITGQDAERGTFSHRHAVLHDVKNNNTYTPLAHLSSTQGPFEIHNSPLSEIGVLGFEYGYSLDCPDGLLVWEAQFGDFFNVAQVFVDQFIASGEDKWNRLSGLCMFLPHGFEGQGPEHSSARLERFLGAAAEDNIQVVNLTTPAQFFHCLRRQVVRPWRKPLIVMSPKSLLRLPEASSTLEDLAEGKFQHIIPDVDNQDKSKVKRIVLCSGKVYYELAAERAKRNIDNIAIIRLEQYYPFPKEELQQELATYRAQTPVVWVQEEPRNMGAWPFLRLRFGNRLKGNGDHPLKHITRAESSSPATGSKAAHVLEQNELINRALSL